MFIHIFGFRWKPEATDADKARAAHDIAAFRDHIVGLIDVHVGPTSTTTCTSIRTDDVVAKAGECLERLAPCRPPWPPASSESERCE